MFRPLAINKNSISPRIQTKVHGTIHCVFLGVADAVDDFFVDAASVCLFCCLLPPLSIPWGRGFLFVMLLLIVGRWSLIAVKSGPTPLFIAKH